MQEENPCLYMLVPNCAAPATGGEEVKMVSEEKLIKNLSSSFF